MATHTAVPPWLRHIRLLKSMRRLQTRAETGLAGVLLLAFGIATGVAFTIGMWQAWALAAVVFAGVVLGAMVETDAVVQRADLGRAREAMVKTNTAKPTGAPRVAEVPCLHGHVHRFVYGSTGWELAEAWPLPADPEEAPKP